jgi:hypothetical protein
MGLIRRGASQSQKATKKASSSSSSSSLYFYLLFSNFFIPSSYITSAQVYAVLHSSLPRFELIAGLFTK